MVFFLQRQDLVNPFSELVDIFILTFPHGFVPVVGLAFDLLSYRSKISVGYRFVGPVEYDFDNVCVCYSLNG